MFYNVRAKKIAGAGNTDIECLYIPKKKNTIEIHTELRAQCNELFASESPTRKKRAHRKTPDKIEMQKLTKLVALRWKNADENVRSFSRLKQTRTHIDTKQKCEDIQRKYLLNLLQCISIKVVFLVDGHLYYIFAFDV